VRDHDLASEQMLLLDAIAALVSAVAAYGPGGECHYWSASGPPDMACSDLCEAMQALARRVSSLTSATTGNRDPGRGHTGALVTDIRGETGRYRLRAVPLQPGLRGSDSSVLVIADRLPDDAIDRARIRQRFRLTKREAEVAMLLADRRRNAEIARALGISVHTARHHVERVLRQLGGCKRRDVERVLRTAFDVTEEAPD